MSELNMGVIGLGMGASHGARVIRYSESRLAAVCDTNPERIEKVFASYTDEVGLPEDQLPTAYTNMEEMLDNKNLDGVIISLPTGLHMEAGIAASQRGVNILMDKPLEINVEKCDAVINACKKNNVRLGVIYPMHFNPLLAGIKKAIDRKLIGNLIMVDIHLKWYRTQEYYDRGGWRGTWDMDGGGSLMNQGAHPVDYMVWLCGEPAEITGDYGPLVHTIDTEDWAAGTIRFKNGVRGTILTTTNVTPDMEMQRIEVHGTEGSIMVEINKNDGEPIKVSTVDDLEELGKSEFDYPVEQFIHALKYNEDIEVTGPEARASVAIINGVYRSADEGRRINVLG